MSSTEMVWVQRDETGVIVGVFANQQPGFADEQLPVDDPAVVAFLNPLPSPPAASPESTVLYDHENRLRSLEGQPPLTLADFKAKEVR
jgi:hypothetical protein